MAVLFARLFRFLFKKQTNKKGKETVTLYSNLAKPLQGTYFVQCMALETQQ